MAMSGGEQGILQLIQMMLDKESAARTKKDMQDTLKEGTDSKEATKNVKDVDNAFERLGKTIRRVVEFMIARAIVKAVMNFGREAVAAALESRKEWGLLANAVENAGTSFERVEARTRALAQSFIDAGVAGDEAFAASLRNLVQISGDYEKSLANMSVVADLAAARQISLEDASTLVARAMMGQVTMLKRLGIEIPAGADAVAFLAEKFKGAADAMDPAIRQQIRLHEEWDNFKESVGEALIAASNGESIIGTLIAVIKAMTKVVEENRAGIVVFGKALTWLARGPAVVGMALFSGLAKGAELFARGMILANEAIIKSRAAFGVSSPEVEKENEALKQFVKDAAAAADAADKMARAVAGIGAAPGAAPLKTTPRGPIGGAVEMAEGKAGKTPSQIADEAEQKRRAEIRAATDALEFDSMRAEGLQRLIDLQNELNELLNNENLTFEEKVAIQQDLKAVQEALLGGLKQVAAEAGVTEAVLKKALSGDARGTLKELSKEARGRAAWNVAKAIEETARAWGWIGLGNFPSAAAAKLSAAAHWASAAKWAGLAGGAAVAGGGGGGASGGAAGTQPENVGGAAANGLRGPGVSVTIYVDGIDPDNTKHQDQIAAIQQQVKERYGEDSQITVMSARAA